MSYKHNEIDHLRQRLVKMLRLVFGNQMCPSNERSGGQIMKRLTLWTVCGLAVLLFSSMPAFADFSVVKVATNGTNLSASAQFTLTGTTLTVVLTNTSLVDVDDPPDILTAVFFTFNNLAGV